jgi:hypothetical protein
MGILNRIDAIVGNETAAPPIAPDNGSAFTRGLRAGASDIAGQTHALLGQGGELAGANDFAANQRAQSVASQQEAERLTADTPTLDKVHDLRSGFDYGAGLIGRSLPGLAAGVAGATLMHGKGPLAGIAGMTLATAPSTIGGQFQAQQADPAQAQQDVLKRTLTGVGAGTAQAAAMSVVPQVVGGKLFAKAAEGAAAKVAMPFGRAVAENVPEAVLGNAAAGAANAGIGQQAAGYLNPNRDASNDTSEMLHGAAEGALMGAPFAALGIAGSMRGKKAGGAVEAPLARSTDAERATGVPLDGSTPPAAPAPKTFSDKVSDLGSGLKADPVTGEDHVQAAGGIVHGDTPETALAKDTQGNAQATTKAQNTIQKLLADPDASQFHEALGQLDPTSSNGQMEISKINAQQFTNKRVRSSIDEANAALDALKTDEVGTRYSKDASGLDKGIYEHMDTPEFRSMNPADQKNAATLVRNVMDIGQDKGTLPVSAIRATVDAFGKDTVSRLTRIYDAMGSKDPVKVDSFYKALGQISDVQKSDNALTVAVRSALPEHLIDSTSTDQIRQFVQEMKDLTGERAFKDMSPAEQAVKKGQINDKLKETFGANADAVNEAFAKHAQGEADLVGTTPPDRTETAKSSDEHVESAPADEFALGKQNEQQTEDAYYGGGKKGGDFVERSDVARARYGDGETAHERIARMAQSEHPNGEVSFVSAKDYAKEHGIPDDQLNEMTKGRPDDHGMVIARDTPSREAFGFKDIDAMRIDSSKTSHYESKSRIDTGSGVILDAMRVAGEMMKKLPHTDYDEQGGLHRLARAFKEGIGAVSDHLSEAIDVPPETVVARRGGKDVTWGELQKLKSDTSKGEPDADPEHISKLKRDLNKLEVRQAKFEEHGLDPETRLRQHGGEPLTAREFADITEARGHWKELEKQRERLSNEIDRREAADNTQRIKDDAGKTDLTADENIHTAASGTKDVELQRKVGLDGAHLQTTTQGRSVIPKGSLDAGTVTKIGRGAIDNRISTYESSVTVSGRAVGKEARALFDHFDQLSPEHQAQLAKIIPFKDPRAVGGVLESLTKFYKGKFAEADGQQKWADTVAGEGGAQHAATLKGIERRNDPKSLQAMIDVLVKDKQPNEFKQKVIDAANDRIIALIDKDPTVTYAMLTKGNEEAKFATHADAESLSKEKIDPTKGSTADKQKAAYEAVTKIVGDHAEVNAAADMLYAAGSFKEKTDLHKAVINISKWAMDPTSVGYHESLHWFASHLRENGRPEVVAALGKVADSPYVRNFLREQFKDQPEVLKQIAESQEERTAYMFQFHANGMLKLGERGKTIMDHIGDLVRKVLGVWSNDQRAVHVMDYLKSGDYAKESGDRSAVYTKMMEVGRNKTLDYLHKSAEPLINLMDSVAGIGSARLHDTGIPALQKMADIVRLHGTKEGTDAGYLPAAGAAMRTISNEMVNKMGKFTFEEANEAFAAIALGKVGKNAAQQKLIDGMRSTLDGMHKYLQDAGVNVGNRGFGKDYVPRQWDSAYIASHQTEFKAMMQKYVDSGQYKGTVNELMSRLMRDEGSELESASTSARPGDQFVKKRDLSFITAEDALAFTEKNAMRVLTSYIKQGTRRAEWSRRFEKMTDAEAKTYDAMTTEQKRDFETNRKTPLDQLKADAVKQGATPEQMALAEKYLTGVTGQLGSEISPTTRKLFGQMMVYQNIRLLPMGFFSSLIDPVGVAVRGGSAKDVFNNFKRGIMEIPRGFQKNPKYDEGYHFAEDMGVIDNAVLQHVMGASYGLNAVGNKARAVNEQLFKWNLMEQMNTSQRVAGTEAAMGFLKKHKDGDFSVHSPRYLAELGLQPSDIKLNADGRVAARASDFEALGMKPEAAETASLKVRQAINNWVDGAVLRPDQSQKAIWMNDAHFSLIAHMKQFAFSFQDTILKRVVNEAKHGNYAPAVAMAGYIPVMLAADLTKGMIQGGGSQPAWKQDWGLDDYLASATQRAGLLGVGQFGVDAIKDLHHGGLAIGALGGPTLGQLAEIGSTVGGSRGFASTAIDSMPANSLWSGWLPNGITHPNAAGNQLASNEAVSTELNTTD